MIVFAITRIERIEIYKLFDFGFFIKKRKNIFVILYIYYRVVKIIRFKKRPYVLLIYGLYSQKSTRDICS